MKISEKNKILDKISELGYDVDKKYFTRWMDQYKCENPDEGYFNFIFPFGSLMNIGDSTYKDDKLLSGFDEIIERADLIMNEIIYRNEEVIEKRINSYIFYKEKVTSVDVEKLKYEDELLYKLYTKRCELKEHYLYLSNICKEKEEQIKKEKSKYRLSKNNYNEYKNILLGSLYDEKKKTLILLEKLERIIMQHKQMNNKLEKNQNIKEYLNKDEIQELSLNQSIEQDNVPDELSRFIISLSDDDEKVQEICGILNSYSTEIKLYESNKNCYTDENVLFHINYIKELERRYKSIVGDDADICSLNTLSYIFYKSGKDSIKERIKPNDIAIIPENVVVEKNHNKKNEKSDFNQNKELNNEITISNVTDFFRFLSGDEKRLNAVSNILDLYMNKIDNYRRNNYLTNDILIFAKEINDIEKQYRDIFCEEKDVLPLCTLAIYTDSSYYTRKSVIKDKTMELIMKNRKEIKNKKRLIKGKF